MNTSKDGRHIVCGAPSVLKNVEAELTGSIHIWMEHLADKLHTGRLVGVLFFKIHDQAECAIFERRVGGADDDGIPGIPSVPFSRPSKNTPEKPTMS